MDVEENFVSISSLICEPTRARMLWSLLDGRAYTASELSVVADISATAASNHLSKLLEADIVKVEIQGRHRYYTFSKPEVAYVIESLANLASNKMVGKERRTIETNGIKYCRTCYDHLAGFVGVKLADALEKKGYVNRSKTEFAITEKGWHWFAKWGVVKEELTNNRRPLIRQCLDWSERRRHIAGQLGAGMLEKMLRNKWFRRVQFSRELVVTAKGQEELHNLFKVDLSIAY